MKIDPRALLAQQTTEKMAVIQAQVERRIKALQQEVAHWDTQAQNNQEHSKQAQAQIDALVAAVVDINTPEDWDNYCKSENADEYFSI